MEIALREFAAHMLRFLHAASPGDRFFEIEVISTSGEWVGVFARTDDVADDRINVNLHTTPAEFMERVKFLQPLDFGLDYDMWRRFSDGKKCILGCTKRQVYFIRGGFSPEFWTEETAYEQVKAVLLNAQAFSPPLLHQEWQRINDVPNSWSEFEDLVRRSVNNLFSDALREARAQSRTDVEPGQERRDVVAHNQSDSGFWHDLKIKFSASELLFEVKRKTVLDRDDLRQAYCYLKPSLGYFGFLVFCGPKEADIAGYNQTLFRNFNGKRAVLVLNHEDFIRMLEIKLRDANPIDYLRSLYSKFNQSL